jgi:hypothetical protein
MPRLVGGHAGPVQVEVARHAAEAVGRVEREVDGVELDVRDRVQQRGAAFERAQAARGHLAWQHQRRRAGGPARDRPRARRSLDASAPRAALRDRDRARGLRLRIALVQREPQRGVQAMLAHARGRAQEVARRLSLVSSLRSPCRLSR